MSDLTSRTALVTGASYRRFLASDAARWVTGDTIQVGGGSKL
jgi:hypothetical protein